MASNEPRHFKGKRSVHATAPPSGPELPGNNQAGDKTPGCGSSIALDPGQQGSAGGTHEDRHKKKPEPPAVALDDPRFTKDGKQIERKPRKPALITKKSGPIISVRAGPTPWMTEETKRELDKEKKRLADAGILSDRPLRRVRVGASPPSRHASISDPVSASSSSTDSPQRGEDDPVPDDVKSMAAAGPSSSSSPPLPTAPALPSAGGVPAPAGSSYRHATGGLSVPYPSPRVPQQSAPQVAPAALGRESSTGNAPSDPGRQALNPSTGSHIRERRGAANSSAPVSSARLNAPPGPADAAVTGPHIAAPASVPVPSYPVAAIPPGQVFAAARSRSAAHVAAISPEVAGNAPVLVPPAGGASPRSVQRASAQVNTPGAAASDPGPSEPVDLYRCGICPSPPHSPLPAPYVVTLNHIINTHHQVLVLGLRKQAEADLLPAHGHPDSLQCKHCGQIFAPGPNQEEQGAGHVAYVHLAHIRNSIGEHAAGFMLRVQAPGP
ncbi:hypothetical protein AURDEDRAFT_116199 [Auricularia subglabra TFB-10046 SS5]|nr:hypothetical protein AURDEDRAFT_116199 [Auricularia subglabra TFB-10046 SS5]